MGAFPLKNIRKDFRLLGSIIKGVMRVFVIGSQKGKQVGTARFGDRHMALHSDCSFDVKASEWRKGEPSFVKRTKYQYSHDQSKLTG
jgi:hypothetical protein